MMLNFKKISLDDRQIIDEYLQSDGNIMSDRCFASLYIWGPQFGLEYDICDDFLYLVFKQKDRLMYYMPLGKGSLESPVKRLQSDARERGYEHSIVLITEQRIDEIKKIGNYEISSSPASYDYVYSADRLRDLAGKKLHSKRNFVNRFKKDFNDRWEYRPIDPMLDRAEIFRLLDKWGEQKNEMNYKSSKEYAAVKIALGDYDKLSLHGGCLTLDGKMIAFTIGALQNKEVMDILIEKADPNIKGSYQMINREFVAHECTECKFVNREEDMGIEGLRKAKLSYYPDFLTVKYVADFKKQ